MKGLPSMEEKPDQGFVVKDRRKISLDEPQGAAQVDEKRESPQGKEETAGKVGADTKAERPAVLPEVTMSTFIFSLSSSALLHLGEIPDPETQTTQVNLPLAKQIIDTIGMLQEKTKGNLDSDEESFLKSVLYDLRLRYVQKSTK